jgi:SAM-dependent methyltransferase
VIITSGNFSFSLAVARALVDESHSTKSSTRYYLTIPIHVKNSDVSVLSTSFDSYGQLLVKYPETKEILESLSKFKHFQILHEINAWELSTHFPHSDDKFDVVIWNHPHLGTEDFRLHRFLMAHFFRSVSRVLNPSGRVVISLVQGQETRWDIIEQAKRSNLILEHQFPFDESVWDGYVVKRNTYGGTFKNIATRRRHDSEMKSNAFRFMIGGGESGLVSLGFNLNNLSLSSEAHDSSVVELKQSTTNKVVPSMPLTKQNILFKIPTTKDELKMYPVPSDLNCLYCSKSLTSVRGMVYFRT